MALITIIYISSIANFLAQTFDSCQNKRKKEKFLISCSFLVKSTTSHFVNPRFSGFIPVSKRNTGKSLIKKVLRYSCHYPVYKITQTWTEKNYQLPIGCSTVKSGHNFLC